jgi:hypothetical protein
MLCRLGSVHLDHCKNVTASGRQGLPKTEVLRAELLKAVQTQKSKTALQTSVS